MVANSQRKSLKGSESEHVVEKYVKNTSITRHILMEANALRFVFIWLCTSRANCKSPVSRANMVCRL